MGFAYFACPAGLHYLEIQPLHAINCEIRCQNLVVKRHKVLLAGFKKSPHLNHLFPTEKWTVSWMGYICLKVIHLPRFLMGQWSSKINCALYSFLMWGERLVMEQLHRCFHWIPSVCFGGDINKKSTRAISEVVDVFLLLLLLIPYTFIIFIINNILHHQYYIKIHILKHYFHLWYLME